MYKITDYSIKKAKQLNVTIRPSGNKKKKIDVIKDGKVIASIGAKGYFLKKTENLMQTREGDYIRFVTPKI